MVDEEGGADWMAAGMPHLHDAQRDAEGGMMSGAQNRGGLFLNFEKQVLPSFSSVRILRNCLPFQIASW